MPKPGCRHAQLSASAYENSVPHRSAAHQMGLLGIPPQLLVKRSPGGVGGLCVELTCRVQT
eukprot:2189468-Pyramimonas_sp.AAC.1